MNGLTDKKIIRQDIIKGSDGYQMLLSTIYLTWRNYESIVVPIKSYKLSDRGNPIMSTVVLDWDNVLDLRTATKSRRAKKTHRDLHEMYSQ